MVAQDTAPPAACHNAEVTADGRRAITLTRPSVAGIDAYLLSRLVGRWNVYRYPTLQPSFPLVESTE